MTTMSREQETMVADRIAFELVPKNGRDAWPAATLVDGICEPGDLSSDSYKRIVATLSRDHGLPATPVNSLYFRLATNGTSEVPDPEVARRYLPRAGYRPPAGIRIQQDVDDPFALLATKGSVVRAAAALPHAADRLAEKVSTGALTKGKATEIEKAASERARAELHVGIKESMQRMLPGMPTD